MVTLSTKYKILTPTILQGKRGFPGVVSGGGGSMVYPASGIALSNGAAWVGSITNNSTNWDTAYADRMKWDGGATGLVAATGRTSLGLVIGSDILGINGTAYDSARLGGALANTYAPLANPTFTGTVTATDALVIGGGNEIWSQPSANTTVDLYINHRGYAGGFTQFRNTRINDGKGNIIAFFDAVNNRIGISTITPNSQLTLGGYGNIELQTGNTQAFITHLYTSGDANDNITLSSNFKRTTYNSGTIPQSLLGTAEINLHTSGAGNGVSNIDFLIGAVNTVPSTRMRIDSNGNVLIGQTSGSEKLCVAGNQVITSGYLNSEELRGNTTFISGFYGTGYKMFKSGSDYNLECDNITVRKGLKAFVFEVDKIDIVGGSLVISPASGTVYDMSGTTLYFDTSNNSNPIQFKEGDYIAAQKWVGNPSTNNKDIIASYRGRVTGVVQSPTLGSAYITTTTISGTAWIGMKLAQMGSDTNTARQNLLYMTASDDDNPYIEGHSGVTTGVLSDSTRKFRLGNLTGITGTTLSPSGYGLYSQNVFLSGKIVASSGLIGNWSINSTYLTKDTGTDATSSGMSPTDYPFYAGATYANRSAANFQITPKGLIIGKFFVFKYLGVGNTVMFSSNAEVYTTSSTYVKLKTLTFGTAMQGTKIVRVKFDLRISTGTDGAYGRVYRNGSAVGTEQITSSTGYITMTEDISGWAASDTIELWVHSGTGYTALVQNFAICGEHVGSMINEVGDNS